jgi:hypothetical protein
VTISRSLPLGLRERSASAGSGVIHIVGLETTMEADLDTLCTVVYCTAGEFLRKGGRKAQDPCKQPTRT